MIKIITDDGADVPVRYVEQYNLDILPIAINDGEHEFFNGVNITKDDVYNGMREGKVYKTAQVTLSKLIEVFTKYASEGVPVIYLPLSSGISGTYSTAVIAMNDVLEKFPDAKIEVVDSLSATFGEGMLAIKLAKLRDKGMEFESLVEKAKELRYYQEHIYSVDTLEYLYRGGRVSKASKVVGGLLNIKPILGLEKEKGTLNSIDKARGSKGLFSKILENMNRLSKDGEFNPKQTIAICHGDWEEEALRLKEYLVKNAGMAEEDVMISFIGPVIGAHTGPEILGVCFSTNPDSEIDYF
ncbi:DegV family protein [Microaceticoccus formicicus]|uniref:DegV family protein n=1 Tax=Microaceticoccus formicicus TaxID=3118105 RepID=UPI003CD03D88|nr:DegV family protein [Peptoniphilaceae bacterium AMB_02]